MGGPDDAGARRGEEREAKRRRGATDGPSTSRPAAGFWIRETPARGVLRWHAPGCPELALSDGGRARQLVRDAWRVSTSPAPPLGPAVSPARRRRVLRAALPSLALAPVTCQAPSITVALLSMAMDPGENRYLLAGSLDGSVAIFDTHAREAGAPDRRPCVLCVRSPAHSGQPPSAVASVGWFPEDSSVFFTGSADGAVRIWDANAGRPACTVSAGSPCLSAAMSPAASTRHLLAVGTASGSVRLCDPVSALWPISLPSHSGGVYAMAWMLHSEHLLATAGADRQVHLCDIRRPGVLARLDLNRTASASATGAQAHGVLRAFGTASLEAAGHGEHRPWEHTRSRAQLAKRAHDGAVTTLLVCAGGLCLLTGGTDDQLRLWVSGPPGAALAGSYGSWRSRHSVRVAVSCAL